MAAQEYPQLGLYCTRMWTRTRVSQTKRMQIFFDEEDATYSREGFEQRLLSLSREALEDSEVEASGALSPPKTLRNDTGPITSMCTASSLNHRGSAGRADVGPDKDGGGEVLSQSGSLRKRKQESPCSNGRSEGSMRAKREEDGLDDGDSIVLPVPVP